MTLYCSNAPNKENYFLNDDNYVGLSLLSHMLNKIKKTPAIKLSALLVSILLRVKL